VSRPVRTARRSVNLDKLFDARAVAVIGASNDLGKVSAWPMLCLQRQGYVGKVYAVNPKYQEVLGRPCVPSIADLPPEVEAGIIVLPAAAAVAAVEECGAKGIRAVVVGASGFGESGADGKQLERRLRAAAEQYDMAIVGPNSNGVANFRTGQALSYQPRLQAEPPIDKGGTTVISHSGAMVSAIVSKFVEHKIGLNAVVACGNQTVLSMEDYLDYFARDPNTSTLVLFVETIKDPDAMRSALAWCRSQRKVVVVLKVGASEAGQRAAASHTGAVAGSFVNTIAFFDKEGAICVDDLEELAVTVDCVSRQTFPIERPKVAIITISGGLAALIADSAQRAGIAVENLSSEAAAALTSVSQSGAPTNPYDLARYSPELVGNVMKAFASDSFNVLLVGIPVIASHVRAEILRVIASVAATTFPHVYFYCSSVAPEDFELLAGYGPVVAKELHPLLSSLSRLHAWRPPMKAMDSPEPMPAPSPIAGPSGTDEWSIKAWLGAHGLRSPKSMLFMSSDRLSELRRPIVLKGASDKVAHKTELGLVQVGLTDDSEIDAAAARMSALLREVDSNARGVMAEEMILGAVEAYVGCTRDPKLGVVVAVGSGGIDLELVRDVVVLVAPFTRMEAMAKLENTHLWRVLTGFRGRHFDAEGLLDAVELIGRLGISLPGLVSLEVNPLFVTGRGVFAGDAKLVIG